MNLQNRKDKINYNLSVWKDGGFTSNVIYKLNYKMGQAKGVGSNSYTFQQRMEYLKRGENLPSSGTSY